MSIALLIVGLLVGGLGSYMMSAGQIGSQNSQISDLQSQVTTLQGSVNALQASLSSSEAQVAALDQQLMALQVPMVTILSCPSTVSVGDHFAVTWNVTGGIPGKITHSAIHLGTSEADVVSLVVSGDTPQAFTASVPAPNRTGSFSIRAHAIVDGTSYFSGLKTITVEQSTSFNLQISAARILIEKGTFPGKTLTVTVTSVNGFNSPVTLSLVDVPPGVTATLSPTIVTPSANGQVMATLNIEPSTVILQTLKVHTLYVMATSDSINQSDALQIVITNPPSGNTISIVSFTFYPSTITIHVGSTVVWINIDPVTHTVTSSTGLWDSGDLPQGQSFSYTFNTIGTFDYHDKYNNFTGEIIIVP